MRILVSLENGENLDILTVKLCRFLSIIEDDEIFVDVLHVHNPVKINRPEDNTDTVKQIIADEYKMKMKLISNCESAIENFLMDNLDKKALVNSYLLEGDYQETLKKHIIFHTYHLLILNPSKKKDLELILKGRNTHWIIDNLEIPVLVLPSYLRIDHENEFEVTCFVDQLETYMNLERADLFSKIKKENIKYVYFGENSFHENVEAVFSRNPLKTIKELTGSSHANHIFVLAHKNKGNFLRFLDKSFTKHVTSSLENPLLVF